ncbi:hypothetical protein GQ602_006700 [Ophiocordyceps camponoti-floridani]|uniref:Myb-like DNA-binding domain-containing protein n=1 Tax=Ophiocordyceps camponoti-floridani TaxID=2030778 RepID=A0A8H4VB61_9HYPO|nr:hypothetical protein GQ602_006700 [Ophiocordyceps camponoti-floridani]
MSKQDTAEQVKFLVCCIKHTNAGRPDFDAVAKELNIVSKAAAGKRYERLIKAYGVTAKRTTGTDDGKDVESTPQPSPVKRSSRRNKLPVTKKRKLADVESDTEVSTKQKPVGKKKVKVEDESELTEPLQSEADDEM